MGGAVRTSASIIPRSVRRPEGHALANAVDLHIELNAVIFEDGLLIGPDDHSRLTDLFSTYVQAK